ncbi:MAG: helicase HerA-like domain-containing protein [Pseudomonadota bacterium]
MGGTGDGSDGTLFLGGGGADHGIAQRLDLRRANRHGLIAGATGTGKTVTLQIMAEGFSAAGVPVFMADVKGDLTGLAQAGSPAHKLHDKLLARAGTIGLTPYAYGAFPAVFWDLFGKAGHPIRTTVSEMGPLLLTRLLDLSEAQEGALHIAFRLADEEGLLLLDLKDLRAILTHIAEHRAEVSARYGAVSTNTLGAIQRRLLVLENEGGGYLFGEPALSLTDLTTTARDGRGQINILAAARLMRTPRLYATFLLWLLSELFEELPEVGDPDKPVLVFFFDEAHLLFDRAPPALVDKVEQVARLIRSKGVGVYFVTQNPADIPDSVLGQLGNRVQHALRAYTPKERKALRAAADSFRPNPAFDTGEAIVDLGIGEALVSTLGAKGAPSVVERTLIRPPSSRLGPAEESVLAAVRAASPLGARYDQAVDRESAFEILTTRAADAAAEAEAAEAAPETPVETPWGRTPRKRSSGARRFGGPLSRDWPKPKPPTKRTRRRRGDSPAEAFTKSLARSLGSGLGRKISRGILGGLFRGR